MMEVFVKIVYCFELLAIFAKMSMLDVREGPKYDSDEFYLEKQPLADVLQNRCPQKLHKIHWKTLVLESLFDKLQASDP